MLGYKYRIEPFTTTIRLCPSFFILTRSSTDLVGLKQLPLSISSHQYSVKMPEYIKWDAPGVEVIQPGEKEKIQQVSDQFNRFQMMNFNEHHHCLRGTHLKTQGVCARSTSPPCSSRPFNIIAKHLKVRDGQIYSPRQSPTSPRTRHVCQTRPIRRNHALLISHSQTRPRQRVCSSRNWNEDLRYRRREDLDCGWG